ncbi:MAG: helix-turn-helix transcriptional regulator [Alphaproteobacteria bacterium]|nr:helix-turn-helix transcriptional regulator [Alphaproteobacteria bacterium]MBL7097208.1 helix-turn-helix transcriptional regulator [Alphaproteobacteria bacterium]
MARAALDWGLRDLEERTGINKNTLARFESGKGVLLSTAQKIEDVFAQEGVRFVFEDNDHGPGIVMAKRSVGAIGPEKPPKTPKRSQKGK